MSLVANPADQLLAKSGKIGGLWVGSIAALEGSFLADNKIDTVISLYPVKTLKVRVKEHFQYTVNDNRADLQRMKTILPSIIQQLHTSRMRGYTVLIHCRMGIRRAPTVCVKYLEKYYYTVDQAHKKLTSLRPVAFCTGHTFRELLFT